MVWCWTIQGCFAVCGRAERRSARRSTTATWCMLVPGPLESGMRLVRGGSRFAEVWKSFG